MSTEAMKQALEKIANVNAMDYEYQRWAREALAIAEAEKQEPVGAQSKFDTEKEWGWCSIEHHNLVQSEPNKWPQYQTRLLYTTPQQRTWVGLTEEERIESLRIVDPQTKRLPLALNLYAAAIEAKLKDKNT